MLSAADFVRSMLRGISDALGNGVPDRSFTHQAISFLEYSTRFTKGTMTYGNSRPFDLCMVITLTASDRDGDESTGTASSQYSRKPLR